MPLTAAALPKIVSSERLILGRNRNIPRLVSISLALVLIALCTCALIGAFASYSTGASAKRATEISEAFDEARYFVGAQESLERKYRLEPSPEVRSAHLQAESSMLDALARARAMGSYPAVIDEVVALDKDYRSALDRMFAAVDAGDVALTTKIDSTETDPSFGAIEERVSSAAVEHRADAAAHLKDLAELQRTIVIVTVIVFVPGVALLVFFWELLKTFRRQAEESLTRETAAAQRGEHRYRSLVQNSSDVVLICSEAGLILYQSPVAETAWRQPADGLLDRPFRDLVHPDDQPALRDTWEQLLSARGTTRSTELRIARADGEWLDAELILTNLLHDPGVDGVVATAREITERKTFERQLTTQAFHDALTGLPNRVLFHDRLDQALARAGRRPSSVALLFLDFDNFKQINDSLGHRVGDTLLIEAAVRLRACIRGESTVARLGGDEFVVLLEHVIADADAVLVADRIAEEFKAPFRLEGHEFTMSLSIGIAVGGEGREAADSMLRDADVAMYRAKSEGKGRSVVFQLSMRTDSLERLELENDLRRAIAKGELRVHYQPIVVLDGGRLTEVEALVRWQHPTRGLVAPLDFIPIAEQTGLIVPLGQWVLEEACRQLVEWQATYPRIPPLTVSVNLSPRQFQHPTLLDDVKRALRESGLPPDRLKLEITEGVIMRDVEATITILWQLKAVGVQLAIDDFGTGYSSLSYLKRLPFDVLKIDRSFVDGIGRNQEDTAIVRAVISMAKSLNMAITAEGVETAEQSALLNAWACDQAQGFYFARPLDATRLATLLGVADLPLTRPEVA